MRWGNVSHNYGSTSYDTTTKTYGSSYLVPYQISTVQKKKGEVLASDEEKLKTIKARIGKNRLKFYFFQPRVNYRTL